MRVVIFICLVTALAGCAGAGQGFDADRIASLNPSQQIGKGPLTPKSLLGVGPAALSLRLGPPAFKRAEPDAEVWQYSGSDCALFVYFYKVPAGSFASTYVDARKTLGGPADTSACLAQVVKNQNAPVS
ncbi:MAG: hypothetical protein WA138_06610 [Parvibaculum sp.]